MATTDISKPCIMGSMIDGNMVLASKLMFLRLREMMVYPILFQKQELS